MRGRKGAHGFGFFVGRYIVGPLLLVLIVVAIFGAIAFFASQIGQMVGL